MLSKSHDERFSRDEPRRAYSEVRRLTALDDYGILDTPPEADFDRITEKAATRFDVPIALVSLIDADRQWFKSAVGLDVTETPREVAFCDHAIRAYHIFAVPDTTADDRFRDNPLVTGAPHIRSYHGAPLVMADFDVLGTLCVIDARPRQFSAADMRDLQRMADDVADLIEARRIVCRRAG